VTGACFILPAFVLTLVLAVLYVSTGAILQVEALLWGIKPVVVAIIANVGYRLVLAALKTAALWVLFLAALAALVLFDGSEVVVMLAAGLVYALYRLRGRLFAGAKGLAPFFLPIQWGYAAVQGQAAVPVNLLDIFIYFLRIGSVLFGSGYVLFAYIQQDVVNGFGWLTPHQFTPGPVSTTTAVIGYIMAGLPGAVVATLGIFLPPFVLVILTAPLIPRMRRSAFWGAFLSGINAGVIAAILVTLADLANASVRALDGVSFSPLAVLVAFASLALLVRTRLNATWLILGGALVGLAAGLSGAG
jgi:chromate transporter